MTTCRECGQSSGNRLCRECRLEDEHEHHQKRADEMLKPGSTVTGPDIEDIHSVGGDEDE